MLNHRVAGSIPAQPTKNRIAPIGAVLFCGPYASKFEPISGAKCPKIYGKFLKPKSEKDFENEKETDLSSRRQGPKQFPLWPLHTFTHARAVNTENLAALSLLIPLLLMMLKAKCLIDIVYIFMYTWACEKEDSGSGADTSWLVVFAARWQP